MALYDETFYFFHILFIIFLGIFLWYRYKIYYTDPIDTYFRPDPPIPLKISFSY